ncbi:uncharacterized protein Ufsp1 isoform X8 [Dermacentor albipictus]|uniref:uncharacterized protein Ufsp1 isoform X8 n=1 Tax=Dermacentor albipictus TaxID=60249 RepID=UPI0038FBF40C
MATILEDVHEGLGLPSQASRVACVKGKYAYYHYGCDGVDDRNGLGSPAVKAVPLPVMRTSGVPCRSRMFSMKNFATSAALPFGRPFVPVKWGWGCGYRTLQTICSWVVYHKHKTGERARAVPSITEIQAALVTLGDKEAQFNGSRDWIGSTEVFLCLDHFYQIAASTCFYDLQCGAPSDCRLVGLPHRTADACSGSFTCPLPTKALNANVSACVDCFLPCWPALT